MTTNSKVQRVCTAANEHGWEWSLMPGPGEHGAKISLTRGAETMVIHWDAGGSLMHPLIYSITGIKKIRLRNVSAAIKQMADKPNLTAVRTRRVATSVKTEEGATEITREELPFDIKEATDVEIIKALRGKTLVWWNTLGEQYENGQVPDRKQVSVPDGKGGRKMVWRTSRNIYLTTSSAGRRIITFPAVNEQFRSVGLDAIVQIT